MRQLLLTLSVLLLFVGCTKTIEKVNIIKVEPKSKISNMILKIPISFKDNGYQNLKTIVIKTQTEFDNLINNIKKEKNWDKKENFLTIIKETKINFDTDNLLIYTFSEDKSTVVTAVNVPLSNENNIIIKIGKDKTKEISNKIVYYALAYKVKKSVKNIIFDDGTKKVTIPNN